MNENVVTKFPVCEWCGKTTYAVYSKSRGGRRYCRNCYEKFFFEAPRPSSLPLYFTLIDDEVEFI